MNFEEYKVSGRARYVDFVAAVRTILTAAVEAQGMVPHAITGRAKETASLEKKLRMRGIDPASAIDEQLKDLAGARIVFLTNSQVARFSNSGAIYDNFEVLGVNIHHPVPGTETEDRLFDSTNYLVQLKPDRLSLPEYARFAGMRAEIQLQTLLNHAWAEMGHDTIYKEPALQHVDKAHLEQIEKRMIAVMRKHLVPAGHEFDKIARDFARIVKADQSVDEVRSVLQDSNSNDALAEALEALDTAILPLLADRAEEFRKLVPMLVDVVERSRNSKPGQLETVFGMIAGKAGSAVARGVSSIITHHRLVDRPLTFETLVRLFLGATDDAERKVWVDAATSFAEHSLEVWRQAGPMVQHEIVEAIEALEPERVRDARGLLVPMLGKVLSTTLEGTERGAFNTILIHTGSVGGSRALRKVRSRAIALLERLLDEASDDAARRDVLDALRQATRPPYQGGDEALRTMVMEDAAAVASIERARAPGWSLELRRQSEVRAFQTYRMFHRRASNEEEVATLAAARTAAVTELLALRDTLNADPEFALYKTLVGRDSVAPSAWAEEDINWRRTGEWRQERNAEIVATIDAANIDEWLGRMRGYLTEGSIGADSWPMADFAEALAEARPEVAVRILDVMDDTLAPLLVGLLHGFDRAERSDMAVPYASAWIDDGRHLRLLIQWLANRRQPGLDLLARASARACEMRDDAAVLAAIDAAATHFERAPDRALIDEVLMPLVTHAAEAGIPEWVNSTYSISNGGVVSALDEHQARTLLGSFVSVPRIDYEADRLLARIADRFPELVLDFFGQRISRERRTGEGWFEAVPYDIHELRDPLSKNPAIVVAEARRWHDREPVLHQYLGGRLLKNVFPELTGEFADALQEIVKEGDASGLGFVLTTLVAYEGNEAIFPLCMDVVDRLDAGDAMLGRVSQVLGERGVMSGEFGAVDADRNQLAHLQPWLEDTRPKVQAFTKAEVRRVEQSMAAEQRRAELDVEQRKLDWGGSGAQLDGDEAAAV
ncbi:RelA/SpoT domain-containing protein [Sphingomonas sp. PR090111-T3T-6A]|uniref:RelA/SpoT domain-containing protein n=1 Tax=Sphingomonas sp. PR090111-T3T-6A TaxID=685778 RepID=UPI00035C9ADB|nr:RelA/SpoT domain-containing protein [Sphingomonas sp. PR090111-T3T-6A]